MLYYREVAAAFVLALACVSWADSALPDAASDAARGVAVASSGSAGGFDSRLEAARRYVEKSPRYLHHSKLVRGMKGYGLSVFEGTRIERFDVEIVSVDLRRMPGRDAVLARVNGRGLDVSGVISGMSGSPIYVKYKGEDRMIGALSFGYHFEKPLGFGSLCGIQPITQMLAVAGIGSPEASSPVAAASGTIALGEFHELLNIADRTEFDKALVARTAKHLRLSREKSTNAMNLPPLSVPFSIAGGLRGESRFQHLLSAGGFQAMGPTASAAAIARLDGSEHPVLQPGSSLVVAMVTGDVSYVSLGTVTDIVDGNVLGFGHSLFGRGSVKFPMGTGYVHTVVASNDLSFKSGCLVDITGTLTGDEYAAVSGVEGAVPDMMAMHLIVERPEAGSVQQHNFNVAKDRDETWWITTLVIEDTLASISGTPNQCHVAYSVKLEFDSGRSVEFSDMSSSQDSYSCTSDLGRWLWTMMNNPFEEVRPRSVAAKLKVLPGEQYAEIVSAKCDRNTYPPGCDVLLQMMARDYYGKSIKKTLRFELPEDLPDGEYSITIGDRDTALQSRRDRRPRFFAPRNVDEVFESMNYISSLRNSFLYLYMQRPEPVVSVDLSSLKKAPATVGDMLLSTGADDMVAVTELVSCTEDMGMEIYGSTSVNFTVSSKALPR